MCVCVCVCVCVCAWWWRRCVCMCVCVWGGGERVRACIHVCSEQRSEENDSVGTHTHARTHPRICSLVFRFSKDIAVSRAWACWTVCSTPASLGSSVPVLMVSSSSTHSDAHTHAHTPACFWLLSQPDYPVCFNEHITAVIAHACTSRLWLLG